MFFAQGLSFFLQGGYFLLLARLLGVTEYGIFAGAFALVNIALPYSSLGYSMLFMRYVSADHSKATVYWGNALLVTVLVSVAITAILFFLGPVLTNIPNGLLFGILVVANCLFGQVSTLAGGVFQTFDKMRTSAALTLLTNFIRFVAVILAKVWLSHATAFQWSLGILIASACTAIASVIWVQREIGPLRLDRYLIGQRAWEGVGFSFAGTTQAVYNDVDKTMLSHYGLNRENGFYTLAYRLVDFATTPVAAIDLAVIPRIFLLSHENMWKVLRLTMKAAGAAVIVGGLGSVFLFLIAPALPPFVGHDFRGVVTALRWLCWIPLFRGIHRIAGSALTGSGRQNYRTAAQFGVAGANLLLNLWWIPIYGWIGAAWSSLVCDGLLALTNSLLVIGLWQRIRSKRDATGVANLT